MMENEKSMDVAPKLSPIILTSRTAGHLAMSHKTPALMAVTDIRQRRSLHSRSRVESQVLDGCLFDLTRWRHPT